MSAPNLLEPTFWTGDFHRTLTELRTSDGLWRDEANDLWVVLRHADVYEVESRNETFLSGQGYRSFFAPDETNMIAQDDPRHAAQRSLVSRRFTPKAVRQQGDWITRRCATSSPAWATATNLSTWCRPSPPSSPAGSPPSSSVGTRSDGPTSPAGPSG
ncbi:MAG: hypothetical protein R2699_04220 [Acidimicrobiales bacterium]